MSFQQIRGGKSFGVALEMFEYFKSDNVNRASCYNEAGEYVEFRYVPAGTSKNHFTNVAFALSGSLCEVRAHEVEEEVLEIGHRNRREVEFFVQHGDYERTRFVHFKLTMVQPCRGGVWGFLGAELTEDSDGQKTTTRYALRESIPHLKRPKLDFPRRIISPGTQNTWWCLGMNCPMYMVSQEVSGERQKMPTLLEIAEEMSDRD